MPCQKEENERSEVKSAKTIRMSLSRERHLAVLKRAPDAGLQANRPRFLTLVAARFFFRTFRKAETVVRFAQP